MIHNPQGVWAARTEGTGAQYHVRDGRALSTHGAIDVGLSPHRVVLLVNHLGTTQHMKILHNILLHIC